MAARGRAVKPYQYVVLRCVPRVEREEFVNVGVVMHCPDAGFLAMAARVNAERIAGFAPEVDLALLDKALGSIDLICQGKAHADFGVGMRATAYGSRALEDTPSARFGLLKAPRSTVLQPGPVHGGLTVDPGAELERLVSVLVV